GWQIDVNGAGVDLALKPCCRLQAFGNDGFGVFGAVACDMVHGLIQGVDDAYGQYGGKVLGAPVFLGCNQRLRQYLAGTITTTKLDALVGQGFSKSRQYRGGNVGMNQQGFHGAADAVTV